MPWFLIPDICLFVCLDRLSFLHEHLRLFSSPLPCLTGKFNSCRLELLQKISYCTLYSNFQPIFFIFHFQIAHTLETEKSIPKPSGFCSRRGNTHALKEEHASP